MGASIRQHDITCRTGQCQVVLVVLRVLMRLISVSSTGSVNRPGPVPAFLRSPPLIPAPLDMKPFLQFPLESPHPASIGLFHNFNAVSVRGGMHALARRPRPVVPTGGYCPTLTTAPEDLCCVIQRDDVCLFFCSAKMIFSGVGGRPRDGSAAIQ